MKTVSISLLKSMPDIENIDDVVIYCKELLASPYSPPSSRLAAIQILIMIRMLNKLDDVITQIGIVSNR